MKVLISLGSSTLSINYFHMSSQSESILIIPEEDHMFIFKGRGQGGCCFWNKVITTIRSELGFDWLI